ncbi:MAG: cyclic nucleotide-binding domain-containing protein [Acidobacteriota bacterium]|nr:MAG: cyclic nucleotide-binding domain-containing protein [Acidobacteriota bacterium]
MVEDTRLLKQMNLFKDFSALEMVQISRVVTYQKVKRGDEVVVEDTQAGALYIIKSGTFAVTKEINGDRKLLGTLGRGDHFGEVSLIDHKPRSATVTATEDGGLLKISKKDFEELLKQDAKLEKKLYGAFLLDLCQKLRRTNDYYILAL